MCHLSHYKLTIRRIYPDRPIICEDSEDLSKLFGPGVDTEVDTEVDTRVDTEVDTRADTDADTEVCTKVWY